MNTHHAPENPLLVAPLANGPPWWLFLLFGVVGLVMIGVGVVGIVRRRAVIGYRQRLFLRLFGLEEATGTAALVIGSGQCVAGVLALLLAVTGPFLAGILADGTSPPPPRPPLTRRPAPTPQVAPTGGHSAADQVPESTPDGPPEPARLVGGSEVGEPYVDAAPAGGLLVGMRLARGPNWGGALQALQPIYQVGTGYVLGQRHGAAGGEEYELVARPGYAVGAINVRAGIAVNAVQLVFYAIEGERLNPADHYASPWTGSPGGGPFQLDPAGEPITGIFGTRQEDLTSVGVERVPRLAEPVPLASEPPPDLFATPRVGKVLGQPEGPPLSDTAPPGGVLVGLRAYCDDTPQPTVRALQPLYLVGDRYVEGARLGEGGEQPHLAIALPGFAVHSIAFARSGRTCGVRLSFARMTSAGWELGEAYDSVWLGYAFDQPQEESPTGPRFAAGITLFQSEAITAVALMTLSPRSADIAAHPPELPTEFRRAALARASIRANNPGGKQFSDAAPEGGLLVGLRCAKGPNWGGALQAVQPIYQVGSGYVSGTRHGQPGGDEIQLVARPGYAIGAINARAGLVLNAIQVEFYRLDGERLDPADRYASDWVGAEGGGPVRLDGGGDPITGIEGSWQRDLVSLAIVPALRLWKPLPMPTGGGPGGSPAGGAREFRTWTSADGRFRVEARLLERQEDRVQLERRDGKVLSVSLSQLSQSDAEYVERQAD